MTTPPEHLADVRALARAAKAAQDKADAIREARDEAIRAALADGISQRHLAKIIGISATAVRNAANGGDE